eukprot:TRINITY_DN1556_c0_g2_i1.p1 TRINITY_DN1556_c0_g2~~TRINITY_DN1556_c0_g2_i1.p1  ORF type:complete len:194 (-),score=35.18 TRINITY_DN1556_c0_g2_i1:211-792(-)
MIPKIFMFGSFGLALGFFFMKQADIPLPPLSVITPLFGAICIFTISLLLVLRGASSFTQVSSNTGSASEQLNEVKLEAKKLKKTLTKLRKELEVTGTAIQIAKTEFGEDGDSEEISEEDKVWGEVLKSRGVPVADPEGKKKLEELYKSQLFLQEQIREKTEHLAKMEAIINSAEDQSVDTLVKKARDALRGIE